MNNPPQWFELSEELRYRFAMGNTIDVKGWYINETIPKIKPVYDINQFMIDIKNKKTNYYGFTDSWIYQALNMIPIKNKTVAIIGSLVPWYESMVLYYGGIPTTIEYNLPGYNHPKISEVLLNDALKSNMKFDFAISISSIEHDGLGRYGDPIDPDGDIRAMKETKQLLKSDGILILAVPMGKDMLIWNAHRVYGPKRLPKLIGQNKILTTIGYDEHRLYKDRKCGGYQPIIILR